MNSKLLDFDRRNWKNLMQTSNVCRQAMIRLRAAFVHFLISAIVAGAGTLPFVLWLYPQPFLESAGGINLILLICFVDLVMGPCLTFVIFNKAKKSLKTDLLIVGGLQLLALFYGLYALSISRPVFLTYVVDRFEVVTFADIDADELKKAPTEFNTIGWGNPSLAYAIVPTAKEEYETVMLASANGVDLKRFLRYYAPLSQAELLIRTKALPIKDLYKFNQPVEVDELLSSMDKSVIGYVPVQGIKKDLTALIDLKTGKLVKTVKLRPW
jgi:hypothetical protein